MPKIMLKFFTKNMPSDWMGNLESAELHGIIIRGTFRIIDDSEDKFGR